MAESQPSPPSTRRSRNTSLVTLPARRVPEDPPYPHPRGGRQRPKQYPNPLPSPTTRSSGRRTICPSTRHKLHHETKRPPAEAGARPPSVTAAPITLLRPNQRRGKQPLRPQACTSFPPLPHAALARTNSPRGEAGEPQLITLLPSWHGTGRVLLEATTAFFLGDQGP